MAYQSLYRKYRSRDFGDLMGQRHVTQTLANAIGSGRVAHAYLFCGPRGTGKTSTARVLAKALNCVNGPTATPCDVCPNCEAIRQGHALDVIEIDAASNRNIDDIRQLREQVNYPPVELRYKFYIVDEVHQLTRDSFNAFLKTLEEPPPHVVFVLCTTDSHQLPATILSRCQRFDFHRITMEDIVERLTWVVEQEGWQIEPEAIHLLARAANGGLRDALSLLDQAASYAGTSITAAHVREILGGIDFSLLQQYVDLLLTSDATGLFSMIDTILAEGKDVPQLVAELVHYWRNLLRVTIGGPDILPELSPEQRLELARQIRLTSQPNIMRAITLLCEAENELRWNSQQRLLLELYSVRIMTEECPAHPAAPAPRADARTITPSPIPAAPTPTAPVKSATPAATPAPASPAQAPVSPVAENATWTLPRMKSSWPAFMEWMAQTPNRKKMRERILDKCWPTQVKENVLVLATTSGFVRSMVTDAARPEVKQVLEQCIGDYFKTRFGVQMELHAAADEASVPQPSPAPPASVVAPAPVASPALPEAASAASPVAAAARDIAAERMREVFKGSYEVTE